MQDVLTLYRHELRMAFRERSIVVGSVLMPLVLYPLILWLMFTGITFVMGQTEGQLARIVVRGLPAGHPALTSALKVTDKFQQVTEADPRRAADLVRSGDVDAVVEFTPAEGAAAALPRNFAVRVTFDASKERSVAARDRVSSAVQRYRDDWLQREATARRVLVTTWSTFTVADRDISTGRQVGSRILGMMLPLFFVIMVAVGSFYPAIDSTAGERERGTWETTLTLSVSRTHLVLAKYLSVATLGCLAGVINMIAMLATIRPILAPLVARTGEQLDFAVSPWSLPIVLAGAALLAGFAAAGMMMFAVFARTFKEGQAMITPFYMLLIIPVFFIQDPDIVFTTPRALVPVMNVALMIREAILGRLPWPQIAVTCLASVVLIAVCIRLATFVLRFEDVVIGSYGGSFATFFSRRILGRTPKRGAVEGA
ncbi:MAG TPA: ABC transporter permease [Vicinamibacterales bacterium]